MGSHFLKSNVWSNFKPASKFISTFRFYISNTGSTTWWWTALLVYSLVPWTCLTLAHIWFLVRNPDCFLLLRIRWNWWLFEMINSSSVGIWFNTQCIFNNYIVLLISLFSRCHRINIMHFYSFVHLLLQAHWTAMLVRSVYHLAPFHLHFEVESLLL